VVLQNRYSFDVGLAGHRGGYIRWEGLNGQDFDLCGHCLGLVRIDTDGVIVEPGGLDSQQLLQGFLVAEENHLGCRKGHPATGGISASGASGGATLLSWAFTTCVDGDGGRSEEMRVDGASRARNMMHSPFSCSL
jgi:hypothetical protein